MKQFYAKTGLKCVLVLVRPKFGYNSIVPCSRLRNTAFVQSESSYRKRWTGRLRRLSLSSEFLVDGVGILWVRVKNVAGPLRK